MGGKKAGVPGADEAVPLGLAETAFRTELLRLMQAAGWEPWPVPPVVATSLFTDRRRWLEPHVWVILEGMPDKPSVIAHADRSTEDAEQRMAAYLAWVSTHRPFWRVPAVLVSAIGPLPADVEAVPGQTLAHHLGNELSFAVPGTSHTVVSTKRMAKDAPAVLAEAAFIEIERLLSEPDRDAEAR
jgi:hypothetical protein